MRNPTRIDYAEEQKFEMWDRWKRGESLHQIARLFDRHNSLIREILAACGGIRPLLRYSSSRALALVDRETISKRCQGQFPSKGLALTFGRPNAVTRRLYQADSHLA
jgi:hypothetical protein